MQIGMESVSSADFFLQGFNRRADELDHLVAFRAHEVVMTHTWVNMLVEEPVAAHATFFYEAVFHQQIEIAIKRGTGGLEPAFLHRSQQRVGIDVGMVRVDLAKELYAFRSYAMAFASENLQKPIELRECHGLKELAGLDSASSPGGID